MTDAYKRALKRNYLRTHDNQAHDPISISDGWKIIVPRNNDGDYYKVGIVDPDTMTDHDIRGALRIRYNGKPGSYFTGYIHIHHLPDGNVSVIHKICRDN